MNTITLHTWSTCEIEGSLDSFIAMLKECRENYEKQGYTNLKVEMEEKWEYDDHWVVFVIKGQKEKKKEMLTVKGKLQKFSTVTKNRPY